MAVDQSAPPIRRPLPIPTFDEFILLHKAIMAAVSGDPAMLGALHGARRSFGWNMLGNLLDLGKIAFAPATPEVLRCGSHKSHCFELKARGCRPWLSVTTSLSDVVAVGNNVGRGRSHMRPK